MDKETLKSCHLRVFDRRANGRGQVLKPLNDLVFPEGRLAFMLPKLVISPLWNTPFGTVA